MKWVALFLIVAGAVASFDALLRDRKAGLEALPIVILELCAGLIASFVGAVMLAALLFAVL